MFESYLSEHYPNNFRENEEKLGEMKHTIAEEKLEKIHVLFVLSKKFWAREISSPLISPFPHTKF